MEQSGERYRKLPGRRRGFIFGSSVWMGTDHLLLVKSARFREEYKRFYFRDIQAIVTARAPRVHISTRTALIGALWSVACSVALAVGAAARMPIEWVLWSVGVGLAIAWTYVSAVRSCRCRIYTAVSSEELPSLYRTWTARRFLAAVEPAVAQAQGAIEGNWAEAVEDRQIGPPPEGRIGLTMPGGTYALFDGLSGERVSMILYEEPSEAEVVQFGDSEHTRMHEPARAPRPHGARYIR